ncbi:hypothetical protein JCM8202_000463 [Rhodotorula sphaerocarpa]
MARSQQKQPPEPESEAEYEVERILEHRRVNKKKGLEYHVSWKDYGPEENTWEPAENVQADALLNKYWKSQPVAKQLERYDPGTHLYRKFVKEHPELNDSPNKKKRGGAAAAKKAESDDEGEAESKKPAAKRARRSSAAASTTSTRKSASPQKKQKDEPAESKKVAKAPPRRKSKAKSESEPEPEPEAEEEEAVDDDDDEEEEEEEEEADEEQEDEDDEDLGEQVEWEQRPFAAAQNWEEEIQEVITVNLIKGDESANGAAADVPAAPSMRFLITWKDKTFSWIPGDVVKARAPYAVITFYEVRSERGHSMQSFPA